MSGKREEEMKMKVMEVPSYPEIEIVAKTVDTTTGSIDRKTVKRCLITEEAVDKSYTVVGGDDTVVKTAKAFEEKELFVQLVGEKRSLASFKFYKGWEAENSENAGVTDVFTEEADKIARICECADRMCEANPECDGQWMVVDKDGRRHFLRLVVKSLKANGKIED